MEVVLTFLATLAGSGLAVAGVTAWHTHAEQKRSRRAEFLDRQLQELYGPLHFLCGHNAALFAYWRKLDDAYSVEFAAPEKSASLPADDERPKQVLAMMNRYSQLTDKNNRQILETVRDNFALIDLADIAAFHDAIMHTVRSQTEFVDGRWQLPQVVNKHLGPIHSYSPQLGELVKQRFEEKSRELAGLRGQK